MGTPNNQRTAQPTFPVREFSMIYSLVPKVMCEGTHRATLGSNRVLRKACAEELAVLLLMTQTGVA